MLFECGCCIGCLVVLLLFGTLVVYCVCVFAALAVGCVSIVFIALVFAV